MRVSSHFLSPHLAPASPFACHSRVTSLKSWFRVGPKGPRTPLWSGNFFPLGIENLSNVVFAGVVLSLQSLRPLLASESVNYFFDHNHTSGSFKQWITLSMGLPA